MNEHEHKAFRFELESAEEDGVFSGHAAVFGNIDSGGDIIEKGAFAKTIKEDFGRVKIFFQHEDYGLPIGKPLELREDEKGLYIKAKISDTLKGRDVLTLMRDGVLNELSIGYDAEDFEYDSEKGFRRLKVVGLWEVSVVTWAMNGLATVDEVKALGEKTGELQAITKGLKDEIKAGKLTRTKISTLKPFIAVVKELTEIIGPLLEPSEQEREEAQQNALTDKDTKQTKKSEVVIEIIPTPKGGKNL